MMIPESLHVSLGTKAQSARGPGLPGQVSGVPWRYPFLPGASPPASFLACIRASGGRLTARGDPWGRPLPFWMSCCACFRTRVFRRNRHSRSLRI